MEKRTRDYEAEWSQLKLLTEINYADMESFFMLQRSSFTVSAHCDRICKAEL